MQTKVGILKETKIPPDRRVPVTPSLCKILMETFPNVSLVVQSSDIRAFKDGEYENAGVQLVDDVRDCDVLLGVKEVDLPTLLPGKTYLFFSHTAKKQPYNRPLLQEIVKKKITLVDYEYMTDANNMRLVAFGRWAGIVGAYNGLRAWGQRFGTFDLKPAHACFDLQDMLNQLQKIQLPPIKVLVTGGGRVAGGAMETLQPLSIKVVPKEAFLKQHFDEPVVCRIDPDGYVRHKKGKPFDLQHFFDHPAEYDSTFYPFTKVTDLYMACHYWDPSSPVFMTPLEMQANDFNIKIVADVSCDIKDPIPSTIRASTIAEPFYGYDPRTGKETSPFDQNGITVMAVDNLPGELPRDASEDFGHLLLEKIFPSLLGDDAEGIIQRATITRNGSLTPDFAYLQDYLKGKE